MVLVGCEGWAAAGGPQAVNFCPLINYANPGDRYYIQHPQVKNGRLYYLSFGPGQFLLPYAAGKILNIPFTPLLLQIINLLAHLVTAFFVYRVALLLFRENKAAAQTAVLFFLFSAETLWFFGNGYVHESMVMPFFAAGLYLCLRFFFRPETITILNCFLFAGIVFAGIFFDWLMLFFATGAGLAALYRWVKERNGYGLLFFSCLVSAVAATGLIIWLYSAHYGAERFWNLLLNKYETRNGLAGEAGGGSGKIVLRLVKHFLTGYLPLLLLMFALLVLFLKRKRAKTLNVFLLLHIAVLVYFLVFASFSAEHDYSVLKFSILFSVLAAYLLYEPGFSKKIKTIITGTTVAAGVVLYLYINPPGKESFNGDEYAIEKNAGLFIKAHSEPNELVFHNLPDVNWLSVYYYSKRNSMFMPDADSAYRFLLTTPARKMLFADFSGEPKLVRRER